MFNGLKENIFSDNSFQSKGFRKDINGLRAIAVIAVIINHFNKDLLPNGFLGVDIFFVISGFVITSSLEKRQTSRIKDYLIGFYERRIKRIIPALIFYVFLITVFLCFFNSKPDFSIRTGLLSFFGLSNIYLFKIANNYFSLNALLNPFTQTWSLAVEEQFYLIFPIIVWITGFGKGKKNGSKYLLYSLIFLSTFSLLSFYYFHSVDINAAYYLMPFRFWEMATGSIIYLLQDKLKNLSQVFRGQVANISFLLSLLIFILPNISISNLTLISIFLTSSLISSINKKSKLYKLLTNQFLMHIGNISYSLYLWHWGVISISKWTIGIYWWTIPLQILIIYVFSYISFIYIEEPFRKIKTGLKGIYTIIIGLFALVSSAILYMVSFLRTPMFQALNRIPPLNEYLYLGKHTNQAGGYFSEFISATYKACFDHDGINDICITNPITEEKQNILLIGDSHAGHLIPLVGKLHHDYGLGISVSTSGIYPTKHFTDKYGINMSTSINKFNRTNKSFENRINFLSKNDIFLLSSRLDFYFIEPIITPGDGPIEHYSDSLEEITANKSLNIWLDKISQLAKAMDKKGINIIINSPLPIFKGIENPPPIHSCKKEWFRPKLAKGCLVFLEDKKFLKDRIFPITRGLRALEKEYKNIFIYDAFEKLCPKEVCVNKIDDKLIFVDTNHLSYETAFELSTDFYNFLRSNNLLLKKP